VHRHDFTFRHDFVFRNGETRLRGTRPGLGMLVVLR
jgi:hypothetical protein